MLETTITIVATILSLEAGVARLDGAASVLRPGDRGIVYHVEEGPGPARWTEVGSGTAVAIGEELALAFTVDQSILAAGDRVLFELPAERLRANDATGRARVEVPVDPLPATTSPRSPPPPTAASAATTTSPPPPPPAPARPSPTVAVSITPAGTTAADLDSADAGDSADVPEVPPSDGITSRVRAWAAAWADQRVDDYLSFYADGYRPPNGAERAAWEAERRARIAAPRAIEIELRQLDVAVTGADSALATFVQSYRSEHFQDVVTKRLDLVWERDDWHIAAESAVESTAQP